MQTVYIVGIVAAAIAIVVVVALLRDRLKSAGGKASWKDKAVEGQVEAYPPDAASPAPAAPPARAPSVDVSGNVMVGNPLIRVWRSGVRAARNLLVGKPQIDIRAVPPEEKPGQAGQPAARQDAARPTPPGKKLRQSPPKE